VRLRGHGETGSRQLEPRCQGRQNLAWLTPRDRAQRQGEAQGGCKQGGQRTRARTRLAETIGVSLAMNKSQ